MGEYMDDARDKDNRASVTESYLVNPALGASTLILWLLAIKIFATLRSVVFKFRYRSVMGIVLFAALSSFLAIYSIYMVITSLPYCEHPSHENCRLMEVRLGFFGPRGRGERHGWSVIRGGKMDGTRVQAAHINCFFFLPHPSRILA